MPTILFIILVVASISNLIMAAIINIQVNKSLKIRAKHNQLNEQSMNTALKLIGEPGPELIKTI